MILTFAVGILTGAVLGYRLRARQAELDVEAVRIEAKREPWECKECGI